MKKILLTSIFCLTVYQFSIAQVANHLVIAEIYGGGGDQGSYWTNDYLVLYNPTSSSINLSNWSIQYAKFNESTWEVTNLIGNIPPNGYYSIQEGGGVWGVAPLPFTPNAIGTTEIDKNKGKLALVNTQIPLTVSNPVGSPEVIDFVGYGNGTNAYEGSGPALQLGLTSSLRRKDNTGNNTYGTNGNGWDTNDNAGDTYVETDLVANPPLPVELTRFSATFKNGNVVLNWRTETEVNNYGFEILRSSQNDLWENIGFVQGNGNSNSPKDYSFIDDQVLAGKYSYRLRQIDTDGNFEYSKVIEIDLESPRKFELSQNYPNPFNPLTTISFTLAETGNVKLKVYNLLGELVVELINETKDAGIHTINFDGCNLNSGFYIYKIESGNFVQTKKMTLIK